MSVNQQTIADKLDLSVATVSRSLRNHKGINPNTRARVLQTAQELGYRLNSIRTRAEQPDTTTTIGVLICGQPQTHALDAVVRTRILEGITEQARRHDVAVHLDYVPEERAARIDEPDAQPLGLRQGLWRGTILVGHFSGDATDRIAHLCRCVKVADYQPGFPVDCVDHDDADSCEKLVNHLWDLGHRQIGYLAGSQQVACTTSRYAGIAAALARRGQILPAHALLNLPRPALKREARAEAIREACQADITAWICENDRLAYHLIEDLDQHGYQCPRHLSICGFDHLPGPSHLPTLTSIDAPFEEMGAIAVSRLLQRLERDALDTIHTMLTCRLITGASTRRLTP